MSLLWNWYWCTTSSKTSTEPDAAAQQGVNTQKLFAEMKLLFANRNTAYHAERKYDYLQVYQLFCDDLDAVNRLYDGVTCNESGKVVYPSCETKVALGRAIEQYLDHVVANKEFVFDNNVLKMAVAKKLLQYPQKEGFLFDWHYWQLFRRYLEVDMYIPTIALDIIANGESSSSEDESE